MVVTVGVKAGTKKICDDTAIVNNIVINDDCYECETDDIKIVGIADGVGGNSGGMEASSFVAQQLSQIEFQKETDDLKEQLIHINNALLEYASSTQDRKQMATTLTAIVSVDGKYYLIHIGNTRMYVGQGSYLKQFTQDHTTYQWLLSHGQAEAAESCNKNEISACMGGGNANLLQQIEISQIFEDGIPNSIIFTSDGIHEHIEIDRLEEYIFSDRSDNEIIREVIKEVENNGSDDDKTLIIVRKRAN